MKIAVLASGPSLTDTQVEKVRELKKNGILDYVISVSDTGLLKAPWSDALCSHDTSWWTVKKGALDFKGRKFSARGYRGTEQYDVKKLGISGGMNSGLFAMFVARDVFEATDIYLFGFDMHRRSGQHFFGKHTEMYNNKPLYNTDEKRFEIHIKQFKRFSGARVYNCTPDSDLKRFPFMDVNDIL